MNNRIRNYWLVTLFLWTSLLDVNAQTSLTLTYGNPNASADSAFNGTVFQSGTEIGDAYFFAKFGGSGTRYFEIDSPGENLTKKVSNDGFVSIRPTSNMIIDQSKIKSFSGPVSGSIVVTVKPLSITNVSTNVTTDIIPGAEIIVNYYTGVGTFPNGLVKQGFTAQLIASNGGVVNLTNPINQYSSQEQGSFSSGGVRTIKATIPQSTTSGSYRVQVATQGLTTTILGTANNSITVKSSAPVITAISASTLSGSYCAGSVVALPFSTTGTFPTGNAFKAQLINADGSVFQDSLGISSASPVNATLPASLARATYRLQIVATTTTVQSNTVSLNVLSLPTLTISGNSTTTAGSTAPIQLTFTGSAPWTFTYTDNSTSRSVTATTNSTTISPTFLSTTTFDKSFIKNFSDAGCASNLISGSAQITINQLTISTATLSGSYCPGSSVPVSFSVNGTLPSSVIYQVQVSDASGNFSNAQVLGTGTTSPISAVLPTTLSSGTGYRIQVVIQKPTSATVVDYSGSASSTPTALTVSRPDPPVVANVSICSANNTTPLSATGTSLKWYTTSTNSQSLSSAPTPPNGQTSVFYVSQSDGNGCESIRQPVSVTVTTSPSAPIVTSLTLCQGAQSQFAASIPNALWYASVTAVTGSAQPPTLNSQTTGDQTVYVTQTINGCESPRTAVKATINSIPLAPTVASMTVCQYSSTSSLTATGSNLTWYNQSGKLSVTPSYSTSSAGAQSYSVTQTINTCESLRATLTVVVLAAPSAPSVTSTPSCVGDAPRSLTAAGSTPKWYTSPTSGTASSTSPNYPTDVASVYTFYVSQTDGNGCESLRQPVSVSVIAASAAPSVNSVSLCQGGQGQFSSSLPNALWYASATAVTGSSQPPVLNSQTAGDQIVYVTQNTNGCESPRTAVKATIYAIPVAPTLSAQSSTTLCQYTMASSLMAVGSSLTWYNSTGKLNGAPTPTTSSSGIQSYSVTQTVNTCESARTTVTIVIRPAPSAPTAKSVRYCTFETASPLTANGSNLKWYSDAVGGSSSSISPPFYTTSPAIFTFYVTQTDSAGCESLRQPVSVSVVAPPSAPSVTSSQIICQSTKASSLTASPSIGLIWQGSGIAGTSDIAPIPVTSQPGTFTYSVVQKVGNCTSPSAQITVVVSPTPAPPSVQTPFIVCVGTASASLSATGSNITWYTNANHIGSSLTKVTPNTNQAGVTTYYVTQRDANNCESPNSTLEVRVSPKATATITGDGDIYPGDSSAIRVRLTGDAPWTFTRWDAVPITITNSRDSVYVKWVRPQGTSQYGITNLTSACGLGNTVSSYTLRVLQPLGIQPTVEPITVLAYPNPSTDVLSVDWRSPTKQTVTLQIIDAKGTIIQQVTRSSTTTSQTELFQLGSQPSGLYFLQIKTPTNGMVTRTIVKQ